MKDIVLLANDENVLLVTETGEEFLLAGIDSLDEEIELIRRQPDLKRLLAERSGEKAGLSLQEVKEQLGLE